MVQWQQPQPSSPFPGLRVLPEDQVLPADQQSPRDPLSDGMEEGSRGLRLSAPYQEAGAPHPPQEAGAPHPHQEAEAPHLHLTGSTFPGLVYLLCPRKEHHFQPTRNPDWAGSRLLLLPILC